MKDGLRGPCISRKTGEPSFLETAHGVSTEPESDLKIKLSHAERREAEFFFFLILITYTHSFFFVFLAFFANNNCHLQGLIVVFTKL